MPRLTIIERIRVVKLFNDLPYGSKSKFARTSLNAKNNYGIFISERGVRQIINKWDQTKSVADLPRNNKFKCLISVAGILAINKALLKNPFLTCKKIKTELVLTASTRTINRCINKLGWRKVDTKFCQIDSLIINRLKRFIYCSVCKINNEQYVM